jgi:hypothetical protein
MGHCVPSVLIGRRLASVVLLVIGAVSCGADVPTQPSRSLGPHKAVYLIYLTDSAEVAFRRTEYPSGVFGVSPEEASRTFDAPLGGPPPGPGILIPDQGYPFDRTKSRGTVAPSGLQYQWVGYFYVRPN